MAHWNQNLPLKVANVLTYILFLGSNGYGALGPNHADWSYTGRETFITPESWFFSLWGIVHILLLGLVVYQFTEGGHHPVVDGIGWRLPALAILNAIYASLSHQWFGNETSGRISQILAFVVMLVIAATVSTAFHTLKTSHKAHSRLDLLLVHLPFSLWHGLSVVLVAVSAFAAFSVDAHSKKPGIFSDILAFIALLLLEGTAAGYASYADGDIAGGAVISLGLLAIFQHQTIGNADRFIHWSALVFFLISLLAVLKSAFGVITGSRSLVEEERAPLLG